MLVHQILKTKPGEGVVTVTPSMIVSDAAKILSEKRIGTVVVSENGKDVAGILSERDIVREIGRAGARCLDNTVADYMTRAVVSCTPQSNVHQILEQMTEGRFRHMPVIEDDSLVGLVSLGDVVKAQLSQLKMEKDALEGMIMGH